MLGVLPPKSCLLLLTALQKIILFSGLFCQFFGLFLSCFILNFIPVIEREGKNQHDLAARHAPETFRSPSAQRKVQWEMLQKSPLLSSSPGEGGALCLNFFSNH